MFDDFFLKAQELRDAQRPFASVVVVRAENPTSGKPGDRALVTVDGTMHGWVGGSCAQPTVIDQAARCLADGVPRLIRLSPDPGSNPVPSGIEEVPMTCFSGGTLDIFIEPHHPAPTLLVVGTLPVARALAHLGKGMSYRVVVVDPASGDPLAQADETVRSLDDLAAHVSPLTFVVVATHGEYDEPALAAALATDAPYIGLVASRSRGEAVLRHLEVDGIGAEARARVRFPAGLDIGAKRGDEIAVSILAEIVGVRNRLGDLAWDDGAFAGSGAASATPEAPGEPETALDPICGMNVKVEGAMHTFEHDGTTYYFCCGGCRGRFAANPEEFLVSG